MRVRIVLALALASLAVPASAAAYRVGGRAWPGHRITYYNGDRKLSAAVALAVRAWNTSGVHVRFVPASRARAEVVIRSGITPLFAAFPSSEFESGTCAGFADLGWWPGRRQAHVTLDRRCTGLLVETEVATHELGHILGLAHAPGGCAVMTSSPYYSCRAQARQWQFRCRYLERDDLRGAIRIYGGRLRARPRFCPVWSAPRAPADLRIDPTGGSISWRNPPRPKPALPWFGKPAIEAQLQIEEGGCAAHSALVSPAVVEPVGPGALQSLQLGQERPTRPGSWCYTLKLSDRYGRGGSTQATFTVPNLPPVASFDALEGYGDGTCIEVSDSSSDPDGQITSEHWDFGAPGDADNTSDQLFSAGHCYAQPGTYTVTLTATDDLGATATTTREVTVTRQPPPE